MLLSWFAVQVKYRHEKAVSLALRGKNHSEFLPLITRSHRSAGRTQQVQVPLFPTYVFCQFDPANRLPILTTPGVFSIVSAGRNPIPVDEVELSSIRAALAAKALLTPTDFIREGLPAVVKNGPLRGVAGIVRRIKSQERLILSISMLQRSVAVEIDRDDLEYSTSHLGPGVACGARG